MENGGLTHLNGSKAHCNSKHAKREKWSFDIFKLRLNAYGTILCNILTVSLAILIRLVSNLIIRLLMLSPISQNKIQIFMARMSEVKITGRTN